MSATIERTGDEAWAAVVSKLRPDAVDALVRTLDRARKLDRLKDALLAEFVAEVRTPERTGRHGQAARWLQHQLAHDDRRALDLQAQAAQDGVGWRTVERVKATAGAEAVKRGRASWWRLSPPEEEITRPTPPTPPAIAANGGTLTTDG
jgi:hypothetical protein